MRLAVMCALGLVAGNGQAADKSEVNKFVDYLTEIVDSNLEEIKMPVHNYTKDLIDLEQRF